MTPYVLLHFEHKNDVTIVIKLHRATCRRLLALYKSLTIIMSSFYVENDFMLIRDTKIL